MLNRMSLEQIADSRLDALCDAAGEKKLTLDLAANIPHLNISTDS